MNGDASITNPGHDSDGIISFGLIENNIIYENGVGGGSGINMDGVTDTIVRNNLLYENHASGISIYQIDGGSGSQDNMILNNTILMAADGRWGPTVQLRSVPCPWRSLAVVSQFVPPSRGLAGRRPTRSRCPPPLSVGRGRRGGKC